MWGFSGGVPTPARLLRRVPVTVALFAAVSGAIAVSGVGFYDIFSREGAAVVFNPFTYTANMLFHAGGWDHYAGNMTLWLPFGTLLTWLTSNRHVFGLAVVVNFLTVVVALFIEGVGLGMSHVVFGVIAAALVRSTGHALQNASMEARQTAIVGLLAPLSAGFLLILVLAGPRRIADFYHFLGFLFGGAIETMYVLGNRETPSEGRSIAKDVGR